MKGWKTWAAAAVIAVSAGLKALGETEYSDTVLIVGSALGLVGVGHKLEKNANP